MKIKSYKLEDNPEGIKEIYVEDYNSRSVFEYNILNHINPDEIEEYAKNVFDMTKEDDFDIYSLDNCDLIQVLEARGYIVDEPTVRKVFDDTDQQLLDEILAVFEASNWAERKEIRDRIVRKI